MKRLIIATLLLGSISPLPAQKSMKIPAVYKPVKTEMYKKGWIDFNKNGIKDIYEDPTAPIDARIEDLFSQMNLNEKTCQMVTLYGYKRVLKDDLAYSRMEADVVERRHGCHRRTSEWFSTMGVAAIGQ